MKTKEFTEQYVTTRKNHVKLFQGVERIAEIGVLRGGFAGALAKLNPKELHLIDPWRLFDKKVFNDYPKKTQQKWNETYESVVKKFSKNKSVKIHRMTSLEAASQFPDNYFDLIYIDANHAYEYVKQDINAWLPKVKTGGTLSGHDYDSPQVKRAVDELLDNVTVILESQTHPNIRYADSWFYDKA